MIVFENGIIKLDYDPTTDILFVDMPTVNSILLPEVKRALTIIVEHVRNYDVKKLLIDARKTEVNIPEETYAAMISGFSQQLMATRLQKVARLVTVSNIRENVVRQIYEREDLTLAFASFTDLESAIAWLKV